MSITLPPPPREQSNSTQWGQWYETLYRSVLELRDDVDAAQAAADDAQDDIDTHIARFTDWATQTAPGAGWFVTGPTAVTSTVKGRRVGDSLDIVYFFRNFSGTFSEVELRTPNGLTVDTAKLNVLSLNQDRQSLGEGSWGAATQDPFILKAVANQTSGTFLIRYAANPSGTIVQANSALTDSAPFAITNATYLVFRILVPITGWGA